MHTRWFTTIVRWRDAPSHTLPSGERMGKPGFPFPRRADGALPDPPTGGGLGKPGFPSPLRKGGAFTFPGAGAWGNPVSPHPACGLRPPRPSHRVGEWGNRVSPFPCGAGAWGNPVSPHPSPRAYVHLSRPCGCAAQPRNEHTVVPGRAQPSQTLPRVGAWGNPVSPFPCGAGAWGNPVSPHPSSRAYVHVSRPCGCAAQPRNEQTVVPGRAQPSQTLPRAGVWGNLVPPCSR